jgi:hypothetical protein
MANRVRAAVPRVATKLEAPFYHEAYVRPVETQQFLMLELDDLCAPDEIEVHFDARSRSAYESRGRRYDDE